MKYAAIICFLAAAVTVPGQHALPTSVVAAGGGYFEGAQMSLSWTLGELAVSTLYGEHVVLTQGFQQHFDMEVGMAGKETGWTVSAYPNPVGDALRIRFDTPVPGSYILEIMDMTGRLVRQERCPEIKPGDIMELNMTAYRPGIYLLKVYDLKKKQVQVCSLRKI